MQVNKSTRQNTIKASEFKAKCLGLMDEVAKSGQELVITKNNRPIACLVPYWHKPATLFGIDRNKITILGDIVSPLDSVWEAQSGEIADAEK